MRARSVGRSDPLAGRVQCGGCGCAGAAEPIEVYLLSPYILLGVALWSLVYARRLHATLADVVLVLFIPTPPPADLAVLMTQASTIIASEARHEGEVLRHGPSTPALHALDATYDRLESPADRLLPARGRATLSFRSSHWLMRA